MNRVCNAQKIVFTSLLFFFFSISARATPNDFVCSNFIDTSYIEITKVNCDVGVDICLNIQLSDILTYIISDNGFPYIGGVSACDFDTLFAYTYFILPGTGLTGPYMIDSWIVDGNTYSGQVANMADLVDSMNVWDPLGNWILDSPTFSIRGGITSVNYGDMDVTHIASSVSETINVTTSLNPNGSMITLDTGYHELIFTEPVEGCLDTLVVLINCTACPDIFGGIPISVQAVHCDSIANICTPIPYSEINDFSFTLNAFGYFGGFQSCGSDSSLILLDTGFYNLVLTNDLTGCRDSVEITASCIPENGCSSFLTDEVRYLNVTDCNVMADLCIEIPISMINNYSIFDNNVLYGNTILACSLDTSNISISLTPGVHQLIFENVITSCRDTVEVMVACISKESMSVFILPNSIDTICIDTSELMGQVFSFENVCENSSGEFSLVELDMANHCVNIIGIEEGNENACLVICDNLGYCDTTLINIEIGSLTKLLPIAVDDAETNIMNSPIDIDVLANDEINGALDTFYIDTNPNYGTAFLTNDDLITYVPNEGFCNSNVPEEIVYIICNENGCDSATVRVTIQCEYLRVHNGFSPNNDGKNDSFVIKGVLNFPGNSLYVYNRWGLLVYQGKDYQNDWQGTWQGKSLTDGTYYYLFDDGEGNLLGGYVLIQR